MLVLKYYRFFSTENTFSVLNTNNNRNNNNINYFHYIDNNHCPLLVMVITISDVIYI